MSMRRDSSNSSVRWYLISAALLLVGCFEPPAPAARAANFYQRSIDVSRATCLIMLADDKAPTTDSQKAQCLVILKGCPK